MLDHAVGTWTLLVHALAASLSFLLENSHINIIFVFYSKTVSRIWKCMWLSHQQRKNWHTKDWNKLTKHEGTVDSFNITGFSIFDLGPVLLDITLDSNFTHPYFCHNITQGSSSTEKYSTVEKKQQQMFLYTVWQFHSYDQ